MRRLVSTASAARYNTRMTARAGAAAAEVQSDLAAILVSRWTGESCAPGDALGAQLADACRAGAAAWPAVELPAERFTEYLAERLDPALPPERALAATCVPDLYLTCACAARNPAALEAFESHYLSALVGQVSRIDPSPAFADEVRQTLRIRLLMGDEQHDRAPAILQYRGQGPLRRWLAVVATRTALNMRKEGQPWVSLDEAVMDASLDSPELQNLRGVYLDDLRQATREAVTESLGELTPEERNLLRWHLVDRVSLRKIAVARGTYVMAVAREYARIRASIMDRVRRKAQERTGLSSTEAASLLNDLASRISITISNLFDEPSSQAGPGG
jgi:RNA polymerase sigma-70 factor, ECF subfamily